MERGPVGRETVAARAAWLPALQEQRAAVESDDVPDDGQAHSRPLSGLREQVGGGPLQQSGELSVVRSGAAVGTGQDGPVSPTAQGEQDGPAGGPP